MRLRLPESAKSAIDGWLSQPALDGALEYLGARYMMARTETERAITAGHIIRHYHAWYVLPDELRIVKRALEIDDTDGRIWI